MNQSAFPWRPLGALLVETGLLSSTQLELALGEQQRTGRLLGEILVQSGYVSGFALSRALAEQHGVELQPETDSREQPADPERRPPPEAHRAGSGESREWRPLGRVLVEKGFLSKTELQWALSEQEKTGRRLGEILVEGGHVSGPSLALALAEQHGVELETSTELLADLRTVIKPSLPGEPVYRVREVVYEPRYQVRQVLYQGTNFLEAADFAVGVVNDSDPEGVEIERARGEERETVWTYSRSRAAATAAAQKGLAETFGFDPTLWGS